MGDLRVLKLLYFNALVLHSSESYSFWAREFGHGVKTKGVVYILLYWLRSGSGGVWRLRWQFLAVFVSRSPLSPRYSRLRWPQQDSRKPATMHRTPRNLEDVNDAEEAALHHAENGSGTGERERPERPAAPPPGE